MKVILASASPRRRELMKLITEDFDSVSTEVDETLPDNIKAEKAAEFLSKVKAKSAAEIYPESVIIGCDTTVICGEKILGKPKNAEQCREYMKMLSGKSHKVITGCTIRKSNNFCTFSVCTEVFFSHLSDADIEEYVSTDEPYDKAGGYGIQGKGALLIEKINGDYFNVVGLPVSELNIRLKNFLKEN